jgi:transcriptional regulator with XRE-family HTH domain
MTTQPTELLAAEVRGLVAKKRIRQGEIAKALHISPMAVSRRLQGRTSFLAEEFLALARFLNTSVDDLYGEMITSPVAPTSPEVVGSAGASSARRAS